MKEHLFSSERPIKILAEDQLGRDGFARALAKVIDQWSGHDSLVLAIYGPWGSGKSSLKNMVLDALAQSGSRTTPLEFTPWEWAAQDRVFEGFFAELSKKIGADSTNKDAAQTAKTVRMYGAMLSAASSITGNFRTLLIWCLVAFGLMGIAPIRFDNSYFHTARGVLGVLALFAASALGMFGESADKVATYLAAKSEVTRKSVGDLKRELRSLTAKLGRTVLVIVDDLDRLTPDEIRTVFQLVKANADFPSMVYLLLFQRDTVEHALSRNNEVDGPQFLSKIVQVGFDIPKISRAQLEQSVESVIGNLVQVGPANRRFDSERWGKLFFSGVMPYFETLRDVKRFGNSLSFHFELYKNGDSFDANPVDLIALEVLRQHEAPLYRKLHDERALLTSEQRRMFSDSPEAKKSNAEALLKDTKRPASAKAIIEDVFPSVAIALSGAKSSAAFFRSEWLKDLRPCHPEVFERYFRFSLAPEDLSDSELSSFLALAAAGDRQGLVHRLREFNGKGLLKALVVGLQAEGPSAVKGNPLPLVTALLDVERDLMIQPPTGGVARAPVDMQAVLFIDAILRERPPELRGSMLREAVSNTTALYLPMISFESSDEGRKAATDPVVSEEDAQKLKELYVGKIRKATLPELLSHPRIRMILQFWSKWASEEEVTKWFQKASEADSDFLSLLTPFAEAMENQTTEGRSVGRTYRFALEDFARYANPDDFVERVRRLKSTDDETQYRCRLFLRAFDRWKSTGRMPYPQNLGDWTPLEEL